MSLDPTVDEMGSHSFACIFQVQVALLQACGSMGGKLIAFPKAAYKAIGGVETQRGK